MKLSVHAGPLNAALSMAARAADRKSDTPVTIIADRGSVGFRVTDPRTAISITTRTAAKVREPGEMAMPATRLQALAASFAFDVAIEIATPATFATISNGANCYRLPLCPDPPLPFAIDPEIGRVVLNTADFLKLLEVLPAADKGKTRKYLAGAFMHTISGKLHAIATDGNKMLRVDVPAEHFSIDRTLIIPTSAVLMLNRLLHQVEAGDVTLRRSRAAFAASTLDFEMICGLVEGPYPEYERVIPRAGSAAALPQRAELMDALTRLNAVAQGAARLVALAWNEGGPLRLFLPRQPDDGSDIIAANTRGTAQMAFSLLELTAMIAGFRDNFIMIEVADRGITLRQDHKFGLLMRCEWNFGSEKRDEAAALIA